MALAIQFVKAFIFLRLKKLNLNQNPGLMPLELNLQRLTGSTFNVLAEYLGQDLFLQLIAIFFAGIIGIWIVAAFFWANDLKKRLRIMKLLGQKKNR